MATEYSERVVADPAKWAIGAALLAAPLLLALGLWLGFIERIPYGGWTALLLLQLLVLYPVAEEVLFRGVLQAKLAEFTWGQVSVLGVSFANLVASILFAVTHIVLLGTLAAGLTLLPSLVFGHLFQVCRSLWPPILMHSWYNFLALWWVVSAS